MTEQEFLTEVKFGAPERARPDASKMFLALRKLLETNGMIDASRALESLERRFEVLEENQFPIGM